LRRENRVAEAGLAGDWKGAITAVVRKLIFRASAAGFRVILEKYPPKNRNNPHWRRKSMPQPALESAWETPRAVRSPISNRKYRRLRCVGPAEVSVYPEGQKTTGSVVDLSLHGCCVRLGAPLRAGAFARVEVLISVRGNTLRLAGIVRHRQEDLRTGIEFTDVSLRRKEEIRDLLVELWEAGQGRENGRRQAGMA
jgi:hypothetical protein